MAEAARGGQQELGVARRRLRGGVICWNRAFEGFLREHGLLEFDRTMSLREGCPVKEAVPGRSTWRLEVGGMVLYLKRHRRPWWPLGSPEDALWEWENLLRFHALGLPAPLPLAAGRRRRGWRAESFLLTRGLQGEKLAEVLARPVEGWRRIAREAVALVRRMHELGFCHRDLYLCHLLVNGAGLWVLDLHRGRWWRQLPWRWRVKDLAGLHYSCPDWIGPRERLRLLREYLGGRVDRRLVRAVVRKAERIRRHEQRRR